MRRAQERNGGKRWLQIWRERQRMRDKYIQTKKETEIRGAERGNEMSLLKTVASFFSIKGHSPSFLPLSGNDSPSNLGHVIHAGAHPPTACVSLSVCIYVCACVYVSMCAFHCVCYEFGFGLLPATSEYRCSHTMAMTCYAAARTHTHTLPPRSQWIFWG